MDAKEAGALAAPYLPLKVEEAYKGVSYGLDGFGNLWSQTMSSGTATPMSVSVDMTTNRINSANWTYDANGNTTQMPTAGGVAILTYDSDNRLIYWTGPSGDGEQYGYLADNKRVWKKSPNGTETVYFYGAGGQKLATYTVNTYPYATPFTLTSRWDNLYFGAKLIWADGQVVVHDRLGSVVARGASPLKHDYLSYGEEMGTPLAGGGNKFGTYHRDATSGLDYADQRYFSGLQGRFLKADPYEASGGASAPGSWNRYPYVGGDPVNLRDRTGLFYEGICKGAHEGAGCREDDPMPPPPFIPPPEPLPPLPDVREGGGGGGVGANSALSDKKAGQAYKAFQSLQKKLGELSEKCVTNVVDKLTTAFTGSSAFSLGAFQAFLSKGAEIWDGTQSNVSLAGNVTSVAAAPGMATNLNTAGNPTVSGAFNANSGLSALTSVTASSMTVWVRPSEISGRNGGDNSRNLALLFHEALHAFGGSLGATSYFDHDIQEAFFGAGSPKVGAASRNISDYIRKNCF